MEKSGKIIATIISIVIFIVIFTIIAGVSSDSGKGPGIIGLAAMAGLIAALRAIWKKDKNNNDNNSQDIQPK